MKKKPLAGLVTIFLVLGMACTSSAVVIDGYFEFNYSISGWSNTLEVVERQMGSSLLERQMQTNGVKSTIDP